MSKLLKNDEYTEEAHEIFREIDGLLNPFFEKYKDTEYSMRELYEMVNSSARKASLYMIIKRRIENGKMK